jgi:predicted permease
MLFEGGFTFTNFLMDVLAVFMFAIWLWLFITAVSDLLFRRRDVSGLGKALWVIFMILFPYIGVLAYLIFEGRGMAGRNIQQAHEARDELRRAAGFSIADEIGKLESLKKSGIITNEEYLRLRAKLV